jgi:hypothetical protein
LASLTPVDWINVERFGVTGDDDLCTVSDRQSKPGGRPHPPATIYRSRNPDRSALFMDIHAAGNSPAYIEASLQAVRRRYGSIDPYMGGARKMPPVEIARLRRNLLS